MASEETALNPSTLGKLARKFIKRKTQLWRGRT
jgi:hypothetical protein